MMKNLIPKGGMKLSEALDKYADELKKTRVLYVIEPNLEKGNVTKYGIAGMVSGKPMSRLREYNITFGKVDPSNKCKGVIIWYLATTKYNRMVEPKNSKVFKIEKALKKEFPPVKGRGTERTSKTPAQVIAKINRLTHTEDDKETTVNRVARETTKKYRDDKEPYENSKEPRRSSRLKKP